MKRLLVWHYQETTGNETRIGPTCYIDADYEPVAVRIYAEIAPSTDAKFDIFDDGVSIFADHAAKTYSAATGYNSPTPDTKIELSAGEHSEESAENFGRVLIEKGSWVHCTLVDAGSGRNFTVQLELRDLSEDEESED